MKGHDQKLLDYNPTFIVSPSPPQNFTDYGHHEKKILIHKLSIHEQKKLLIKAFLKNDENYIYEFDKETNNKRTEVINRGFGLGLSFFGYYGFSNYFFWRKIKPIKQMKLEYKFLYLMALNLLPLIYFGYEFSNIFYDLDDFLFKKFLKK